MEMTRRIDELRRMNLNSTQGIHLMGILEGNFNFPSTGFSAAATGWGQDHLPNASLRGIEWDNPKDPDEVFVKYEARLEDGTVVSKSEGVEFTIKDGYFCPALAKAVKTMKKAEKVLLTIKPFEFKTDEEEVIDGLDCAVLNMKKGEVALVTIPPEYAFGSTESKEDHAVVPPNSTLIYEVELVSIVKDKESVYALAKNDTGTLLVSGGTEKVVRVWDPGTGSKNMKWRGHTDNIRALLLDSTGRYYLSGSSDSMIRLWDLGQQRCVHSYVVHTNSVWALASTPSFAHVYSSGRDQSVYLTDLSTRESVLLCTNEHPILQLSLQDDTIWVATTDSSVYGWPAEGHTPQRVFHNGGSFLAGNLSFSTARASLEGSAPVPVYKEPSFTIPGVPAIIQHEIMNNRRHVLTKDTAGSVKLWEITRGAVIEDFGKVSFEDKKKELFDMVSIPAWFTMDARLGCLSAHLDTPQCFSAEIYAVDLNVTGAQEDLKINLAQETLRGLLVPWSKRKQKSGSHSLSNGDSSTGKDVPLRNLPHPISEVDDGTENHGSQVLPSFEFSTVSPPSIITEGASGGPWRKRITDLDGTEDLPWWCVECVEHSRFPKENTKCGFYLHPAEGSPAPNITKGKLSAPRILRIHKVANYVIEKLVVDRPLDGSSDSTFAMGLTSGQSQLSALDSSSRLGLKPWQKLKPSVEILCNNQVLMPEMSLATVRTYIWKKPEDLILNYRVVQPYGLERKPSR